MSVKEISDMENVPKIFKSKKASIFWMWFSAMTFIFFVSFSVYTIIHARPIWFTLGFLMWALFAVNNFRVSLKDYKQVK